MAASDTTNDTRETAAVNPDEIGAAGQFDIGVRLDAIITARSFITAEDAKAWSIGKPIGSGETLGLVAGIATGIEMHKSTLPLKDGKAAPDSVFILGTFECRNLKTGEIRAATVLILPRAAGELIRKAFEGGAERAELDVQFGIEAVKGPVGYAYTITATRDRRLMTEDQKRVAAIRARQEARYQARLTAPAAAAPEGQDSGPSAAAVK